MKNYIRYINESKDIKLIAEMIKRDCQPFLQSFDFKTSNDLLYRGEDDLHDKMIKRKRRHNRQSVDTEQETSDFFDKIFKKKFGWEPRSSGIFVLRGGSSYGEKEYVFFPIGDFRYVWSTEIEDFFAYVNGEEFMSWDYYNDVVFGNEWKELEMRGAAENIDEWLELNKWERYETKEEWDKERENVYQRMVDTYKEEGLPDAGFHFESGSELIFDVDYYYLIETDSSNTKLEEELIKELKK